MAWTIKCFTLLLLVAAGATQHRCTDGNEISCGGNEAQRCIPYRYICDDDPDCGLNEDEDRELCVAWKDTICNRGQTMCRRNGISDCINIEQYCDPESQCEGDLDPRICQMIQDGELMPLAEVILRNGGLTGNDLEQSEVLSQEFEVLLNLTIQNPNCPAMFTLLEDRCVSIFFVGSVSWGEARAFCQVLDGEIMTFRDANHFASLMDHLREAHLTVDFWIGGNLANESDAWRWTNGAPVEMGTPYWAVKHSEECKTRNVTFEALNHTRQANNGGCYHYLQSPEEPPRGHCMALTYEHYYFVTDEDCMQKKSPLCVLPNDADLLKETQTEIYA